MDLFVDADRVQTALLIAPVRQDFYEELQVNILAGKLFDILLRFCSNVF